MVYELHPKNLKFKKKLIKLMLNLTTASEKNFIISQTRLKMSSEARTILHSSD
jgi:hypothetical protein